MDHTTRESEKVAGQQSAQSSMRPSWSGLDFVSQVAEYWVDAAQRATLFWDVMRQRGNQYLEQSHKAVPHVLSFSGEVVLDGRTLSPPANYILARITPPAGTHIDPQRRPFVIIDPRAGHGPGIGGFKADSEIGVALAAGHPCYFIGFRSEPEPGQTIEAVLHAIAVFLEKVNELHASPDGKPAVVANCQAGWAAMIVAAVRPDLFGPIIVAGSPLSYWAGVHGENPMRYTGGLLGGSWLTALTSDLGNGKFDGAWLVQNFESLNPANTLWTKQYDVYANVDTEGPRYLGFEKWWGGHVLMTGEEMQAIVDKLFIGNKLGAAELTTRDGIRVDLRNVKGPIVVFCSKGDNITPPQQALGWILDLYDSVDDIRSQGQTIVYAVHDTIGHLGIFVSGSVARKEHSEFASNIDLIDILPPGLYEAVLAKKEPGGPADNTALGDYIARFEARTLDDIRALGGNSEEDERRFAAAARVSEINLALYRTFAQPWVQAFSNEATAEAFRRLHPLRLQYELLSDRNPFSHGIAQAAATVRADRRPVSASNPVLAGESQVSNQITGALKAFGDMRDRMIEQAFLGFYGMPLVQALVGLGPQSEPARRRPGRELEHQQILSQKIEALKAVAEQGGPQEAAIRALLYIGMPDGVVDERGFAVARKMREEHGGLPLTEFKAIVRQQFLLLLLDKERAIAAIPDLVMRNGGAAQKILPALRRVIAARGPLGAEGQKRLEEIEMMLTEAAAPIVARSKRIDISDKLQGKRPGPGATAAKQHERGEAGS